MREVFMIIGVVVMAFFIRNGCERNMTQSDVAKDCKLVCGDIGFDHDYAVKTGWFSYECKCKKKPKQPVKIHPQG